jgi:hypothetical protein
MYEANKKTGKRKEREKENKNKKGLGNPFGPVGEPARGPGSPLPEPVPPDPSPPH